MPASSRLRRRDAPARDRSPELSRSPNSTWDLGVLVGKYMVGAGVIGVAMGLAVLLSYGWGRNAFPDFGGDEWVPQLARIGVFCSLMVMLLMAVPVLDVLAQHSIDQASVPKPPLWRWGWLLLTCVHATVGLVFLVVVWLLREPGIGGLAVLSLLVTGTAMYVEVQVVWGGARWPRAFVDKLEVVWLVLGGQTLYLLLLLVLWVIAEGRFQRTDGIGSWLLLVAVALLFAVCRSSVGSVYKVGSANLTRVGVAGLSLVIAIVFAPEIVRMAGFANLPHMRLLLERNTACEVARHLVLTQEEVVAECAKASAGAMQPQLSMDADVVSRVGGHYVLTGPGELLNVANGGCNNVHSLRGERAAVVGDLRPLRCVEIPRDAVKAVLR